MFKCYRALLNFMYLVFNLYLCDEMNVPYVYAGYIRFSLSVPVTRIHGLVAIVLGLCNFHYVEFDA
jgi:hypothetical protein